MFTFTQKFNRNAMTEKSIRWKQRFQNFEKAILQLDSAVERLNVLSDFFKTQSE
jgi:hypothetical protein